MLVYEKKVDSQRKIFGTTNNFPSDSDNQLVYKDRDGDVISDLTLNAEYVDDKHGGILRKSDDQFIAVYIKDANNNLINIVPGGNYTPEEKVLKSIKVKTPPTKVAYTEGDTLDITGLSITATFQSGEKETITTGFTTSPEDGATLATTDDKIVISYTVGEVTKTCNQAIEVTAAQVDTPADSQGN